MNLRDTGDWVTVAAAVAIIMVHKRSFAAGEARVILKEACAEGLIRSREIEPDWENTDQEGNIRSATPIALVPAEAWSDGRIDLPEIYGRSNESFSYNGSMVEISRDDLEAYLAEKWPTLVKRISSKREAAGQPVTLENSILKSLDGKERVPWKRFFPAVRKVADKGPRDDGWSDRTIRRRTGEILKRLNRPK